VKIIAIVNERYANGTYLVEATGDELKTISLGVKQYDGQFRVGTEILVSERIHQLNQIDEAQKRLDSAAQSLRAVADLLGTIDVVIPPKVETEVAK